MGSAVSDAGLFVEARDAFERILQVHLNDAHVVIHLAASQPGTQVPQYARLSVADDMAREFLSIYEGFLADYRKGWRKKDIELVPYNAERNTEEHVVQWINLSDNELLRSELSPLEHDSLDLVTPKKMADKGFTSKLRFYCATVTPWLPLDYPLTFYRRYGATKVLGTSLVGAFWDGNGVYDRLKPNVFLFDRDVNCIQYGHLLFIFDQYDFHVLFQFEEAMRDAATQTLDRIRAQIPISNYEELVRDCQKPLSKLLKLRNISQQDYLERLTFEDIERVIADRKLPIEVVEIDGVKHLCYDPAHPWQLLALLDDDYVRSILANRPYQSHSKSLLSDKGGQ